MLLPFFFLFIHDSFVYLNFSLPNIQAIDTVYSPDHSIVATFDVGKPVSVLQDNIMQLQDDIFDELDVLATKVFSLSLWSCLFIVFYIHT